MFIPVPTFFIKIAITFLGSIFPISKGQLTMLIEGNNCDSEEIFKIFGIDKPVTFSPKNLDYLTKEFNLENLIELEFDSFGINKEKNKIKSISENLISKVFAINKSDPTIFLENKNI